MILLSLLVHWRPVLGRAQHPPARRSLHLRVEGLDQGVPRVRGQEDRQDLDDADQVQQGSAKDGCGGQSRHQSDPADQVCYTPTPPSLCDKNTFVFLRIWQKNPEENLGIVVKAQVDQNNQMELEIGAVGTREGPYLTIDIHEAGYRHRTKRTTNRVCSEEFDPDVSVDY